jgi:hypothetical protein
LQSEVNAGTISSLDQSALSTALTDIDAAIQQSRSSDASSSTESSPEEMKSKIDDLIANEVSNGTLTSELKGVFQSAFANCVGGPGGRSGPSPSDDSSSLKLLDGLNQQHLERQHNREDPPVNPQGAPAIDVIVDVVL